MDDNIRNILSEHPSIPPETLLAYLEGRLDEKGRLEVEMAMVDSEFLSDAAEGLEAIRDKGRIHSMVEELNRGLRRRTRKKRGYIRVGETGFPIWLGFAAILLLILMVAGFYVVKLMSRV
jgi:hypothetical protein